MSSGTAGPLGRGLKVRVEGLKDCRSERNRAGLSKLENRAGLSKLEVSRELILRFKIDTQAVGSARADQSICKHVGGGGE